MRAILSFSVLIDDRQYLSLPQFSPAFLKELSGVVAEAICKHDKLAGGDVMAKGAFVGQILGESRGVAGTENEK